LNEKTKKKTFKKEAKDTQLYDITKQSEDIDERNGEMCISSSSSINKEKNKPSITKRKKNKSRGKHAQQSRIVFDFSSQIKENKTGEYNTNTNNNTDQFGSTIRIGC
jgi:hypothetical protein